MAESLGYRQLTVAWRARGLVRYMRRKRDWGKMDRAGFAGARPGVSPAVAAAEEMAEPGPGTD